MSSGTTLRNPQISTSSNRSTTLHSSTPSSSLITSAPPRPSLKRINTPPNLHLSTLMSGDASVPAAVSKHRRSQSSIGRSANKMNSSESPMCFVTRPATSASAMSALQLDKDFIRSPCFVHKTFGDSLNIERVMEECRAEEITHHNLLQTATGVREVARQLGKIPFD